MIGQNELQLVLKTSGTVAGDAKIDSQLYGNHQKRTKRDISKFRFSLAFIV